MSPPEQRASVGRVVRYQAHGSPNGQHKAAGRAAVITEVGEDGTTVGLCVMNPSGLFFDRGTKYDPERGPGTWSWPDRT